MKKILSIICSLFIVFSSFGTVFTRAIKYIPGEYRDFAKYPKILKRQYEEQTGKTLNLDNPKTLNDKILWLSLYDARPIKTKLCDKYLVMDYIKEKVGEKYVVPLLGVWDKFDDIDFDKLPDKFVLKSNIGSGNNIFVEDKNKFDIASEKKI